MWMESAPGPGVVFDSTSAAVENRSLCLGRQIRLADLYSRLQLTTPKSGRGSSGSMDINSSKFPSGS